MKEIQETFGVGNFIRLDIIVQMLLSDSDDCFDRIKQTSHQWIEEIIDCYQLKKIPLSSHLNTKNTFQPLLTTIELKIISLPILMTNI